MRSQFASQVLGSGLLAVMLVAGCATLRALPTLASYNGGCRGVGLDATLVGDPADPRVAWLVGNGGRQEIVWPPGYSARFTPALEILDASNQIVLRGGDKITGGCTSGRPDVLLIRPGS